MPQTNKNGYLYVGLYKDGERKNYLINRLVAEAYIPNPDNLEDVGHKDEVRNNNHASNLYWTTHADNCNYGTRNLKISEKRKKPVYCVELDKTFDSAKDAAEALSLYPGNITDCCKGKRKTTGGYHWRYADG